MFREMRRKEKQLSVEATIEVLTKGEDGVLATIGADTYPYAVPLNYVYHNDYIYFHCAKSGHKIDNIAHHSKVSFCVVNEAEIIPDDFNTKFKSVVVFGTAIEVFDREKEEGLLALVQRFSKDHLEAGKKYIQTAADKTRVFKIKIEHMTGKQTK
jgi:hypothetical protein